LRRKPVEIDRREAEGEEEIGRGGEGGGGRGGTRGWEKTATSRRQQPARRKGQKQRMERVENSEGEGQRKVDGGKEQ